MRDAAEMSKRTDSTLDRIWAEHSSYLKRMLVGLTRDIDLADDLLQETYLHAHTGIGAFRNENAKAWLAAIAKNAFYQHLRRRHVRSEMPMDDISRAELPAPDHAALLDLRQAIAKLSPSLKTALVMKHFGGFTYNEIAERMDSPVGTAKQRVWTAMKRLRTALGVGEEAEMKCTDLMGTRMLDYLYGAAAGKDSAIRSHLAECRECARKVEELRVLMTALDSMADEYKTTTIVDLDAAGMPAKYEWTSMVNPFKRTMRTDWWTIDKDLQVEYAAFQGEEVTLEVFPSSDTQYKYEAPLPHPVQPGERKHTLLVLHPHGPKGWAEKIGDGTWRYSYKTTPNSALDWVLVLAIRLPPSASFLDADPKPAEVRSDGTTTLIWRSMLPKLTQQLRAAGRQWQFECTIEYRLDKESPGEKQGRSESPVKWAPQVVFKIHDAPWTGSGTQALDLFHEAEGLPDAYYRAWFKLGLILYDGRYYNEAFEAFGRVSAPTDGIFIEFQFAALVWLGHILDILNRREEALGKYKQALDVDIGEDYMRHDQYGLIVNRQWAEERLKTPFERK